MTDVDTTKRDVAKVRIVIARELRQIEQLAADLHVQALATPNDRDFPGGTALHMLAPAAVPQDWDIAYARKETLQRFDPITGEDHWEGPISPVTGMHTSNLHDPAVYQSEADAAEQPLNVLGFWTRVIREEREQPTDLKPTLSREVDYIRGSIDWVCRVTTAGEPEWPRCFALATELHTLVRRMEDTLRAGDRIDTDAAPCFQIDAGGERCGGTLARVNLKPRPCVHASYAANRGANLAQILATSPSLQADHRNCDQGGRDDIYRCLHCDKRYTTTEYWLVVREHMEREAG